MAENSSSSSRRWHFVIVGLIVLAVGAFVVFKGKPVGEGPGGIDHVDPVKATGLLNEGLALLENGQSEAAVEKFANLELLVGPEPAAIVNHAIAAVLAIAPESLDKVRQADNFQSGWVRADSIVKELRRLAPDAALGPFLAARLAEQHEDRPKQIELLDEAVRASNGDPIFEAEFFLATRASDDAAVQAKGIAALKQAADKASDNLWLLSELVVAEATAKDADIVKTIGRLRDSSQPFVEFVKTLRNVDLLDLLDKAKAAVEANDWNLVARNARLVSNLLKPEIATKHDQRRLIKHPLEYVVADFSPEWHAKHADALAKSAAPSAAPIEVTFTEADATDQLPPLAGIRDVKIADFDLDGRWDVIVLLNGQVIVFGQPTVNDSKPDSRWTTLCEAVVPSGMTKLVACDLDRDTEDTPEDHRFIGQTSPLATSGKRAGDEGQRRDSAAESSPLTSNPAPQSGEVNETKTSGAAERVEDADIDLLVYGDEGIQFLRNVYHKDTKNRSLEVVGQDPPFEALRKVLAVASADIDHDGDLDLVVSSDAGMSIWQNNDSREHTKFTDISSRSALPPSDLKATVLLPVDWNFDVQTDVLVTGPDVDKPGWLENISHGRLRWRERPASEFDMGHISSLHLMSVTTRPLKWNWLGLGSDDDWKMRLFDFNNDGQSDKVSWSQLAVSVKEFGAKESVGPLSNTFGTVTLCEVGDLDSDGDEDVLVITDQRPIWLRNDGGNKNGWIDLSIRADKDRKPQRDSERVNAHGVGSLIELRAAGLPELPGRRSHVRVVEGQSTHFGLGSVKQVDAARIVWTNGIPQNVMHPQSGQAIAAQQTLKGSCPYLYTWDGEQWAFYTDCLWAAPIGLQLAEGVLAPCREWEYLKIDGDRLRETDGEYRIMLTEELWEATYFDQVRLLAIDHPADVEFFSNDKVGPPSISEFKLHPVRKRHTPIAARDHRGRDVLNKIAKRDERYLRAFDKIIQQGLTEPHFIELDLGNVSQAKNVTLFLTGWIFPTDTSINVSLSQNPDRDGPKPPSIWVSDENGEFREAIPYIGFPGGKTKTISVDLSSALALEGAPLPPGEGGRRPGEGRGADRHSNADQSANNINSNSRPSPRPSPSGRGGKSQTTRLRIVTSMELYWDEMFFTVDEQPLEHTTTELPLASADLQYRGFSARLPHPEFGPERYDALQITKEPQWPPMGGKFTRYGDVTELLKESDDRLAIIGAGDAITIRFRADQAPNLPPGWKRDFVIHNIGYDKDADLSTIYGQFVEPLPFRAMRGYPDPTGAEFPDLPVHQEDQRRYQTREQNRRAFWIGH